MPSMIALLDGILYHTVLESIILYDTNDLSRI
jgi:hypothetical protein